MQSSLKNDKGNNPKHFIHYKYYNLYSCIMHDFLNACLSTLLFCILDEGRDYVHFSHHCLPETQPSSWHLIMGNICYMKE